MTEKQEAEKILQLTDNNASKALETIQHQSNVLYTRAQILLSLAGIIITVTGFSGRLIAGTNAAAQWFLISGLIVVLVSVIWSFLRVMRIRWVTTMLDCEHKTESVEKALRWRNQKMRAYAAGGIILCIGMLLYCTAIAIMLLNPEALNVPVR